MVERVSVCAEGEVIRLSDLPPGVRPSHMGDGESGSAAETTVPPALMLSSEPVAPFAGGSTNGVATVDASSSFALSLAPSPSPAGPVTIDLPSLAAMAAEIRQAHMEVEPPPASPSTGNTPTPILQFPVDLPTMLRDLENRYINAALAQTGSNKKEAAKLLGMGRTTLVEKLRRRASDREPAASGE
jgi:sigma-54 dependent transcriptional regulator, flagellar regulatory protein